MRAASGGASTSAGTAGCGSMCTFLQVAALGVSSGHADIHRDTWDFEGAAGKQGSRLRPWLLWGALNLAMLETERALEGLQAALVPSPPPRDALHAGCQLHGGGPPAAPLVLPLLV